MFSPWARLLERYQGLQVQGLYQQPLMLGLFLGILVCNLVVFLLLSQPFAYDDALWLTLLSVSLTGLAHVAFRWPLHRTTHGLLLQAYVLLLYSTWISGGLYSSSLMWLMILPVPAIYLVGWHGSALWIALVVGTVLALVPLTEHGWLPVSYVYGSRHLLWSLGNHVFTAMSLLGGLLIYQRIYQQQLENIKARNRELSENRAALLQSESYKDQFLASVSHELRTPMNAILGFNDVIRVELQAAAKPLHTVDLVRESTEHLLKLVNQILNFTQLQAGRLALQPAPLRLSDTVAQCGALFQRAPDAPVRFHAELDPSLPPWVMADKQRIQEVLNHLVENAFKFTAQGQVRLSVRSDGDAVRFEVIDTGVGISPEWQPFLFNRFEHADSQTHVQFGGAGLGLAICKGMVQWMGGEIGLQSQPGQGTRVWFRLPMAACEPPHASALPGPGPTEANLPLHLLLVDDHRVNLKVAGLMCQQLWPDATVAAVESGQACLDYLNEHRVDAVLLDLMMPEMDGLQTTQRVRQSADPRLASLVVIGLTASNHPQDRQACLDAGMNDVLVKPLHRDALRECVGVWCATARGAHA